MLYFDILCLKYKGYKMGAKEIRAAARARTAKKNNEKSWFDSLMSRGTRGADAPIGLGPRTIAPAEDTYVDPLYSDAPAVNPQAIAAAYGNRVAPATTDLQGAPLQAPIQRQSVRNVKAAPTAPSVYPQRAVQREPLAPVAPAGRQMSRNPFSKDFSPSAWVPGLGNDEVDRRRRLIIPS